MIEVTQSIRRDLSGNPTQVRIVQDHRTSLVLIDREVSEAELLEAVKAAVMQFND